MKKIEVPMYNRYETCLDRVRQTRKYGKKEREHMLLTIQLDMLQTAALAMILFLIGRFTVNHVEFFQRCCIPAPVIGGLIFAILHLVTYQTGILTFTFDDLHL